MPATPLATPITIRIATPDDWVALTRLAAMDSALPLELPVLVAEVDGDVRAAVSLASGASIADPFHRTLALLRLLRAHAEHEAAADHPAARRRSGRRLLRRPSLGLS